MSRSTDPLGPLAFHSDVTFFFQEGKGFEGTYDFIFFSNIFIENQRLRWKSIQNIYGVNIIYEHSRYKFYRNRGNALIKVFIIICLGVYSIATSNWLKITLASLHHWLGKLYIMEIKRTSKKSASVKVSFIEDNENLIPKEKNTGQSEVFF